MGAMNYTPDYIRTPYHTLLAHRTSELYSKPAKLDGEVIEVTDLGIKFRYEDGTEDFYPLGLKIGVGAGEYHRHTRVTDLRVGDKFKTGDILGWDEMFFERDFANPRQVVWKSGFHTTIALIENQFTFEDSFEMSQELARETKSPYILKEEINLNFTNGFKLHVKVGDEVTKDTILCDIEDGSLSGLESDFDTVDHQLERLGVKQKRSPKNGTVVDIKVTYNGDLQDMKPDVLKVVKYYDRKRKEKAISEGSKVYTGNVAGIKRMKESLEEGRVKIEVYVEEIIESQVADKFVIGNQMKGTIGNIFEQPFMTQDGRPVHLIFSFKSMYNRMVLSLRNKIVTCAYLEYGTQLAINAYRGIK